MNKQCTLFVFFGQIGEVYILKSLIDSYCSLAGMEHADIVLLCGKNTRELVEIAYLSDGYRVIHVDANDFARNGQENAGATQSEALLLEELCDIAPSGFTQIIQMGSTIYQPWASSLIHFISNVPAKEKLYFQYVFGNANSREALIRDAEILRNSGVYSSVCCIDCMNCENTKNTHALEAYQDILHTLFPNEPILNMKLPIITSLPASILAEIKFPYVMLHIGAGDISRRLSNETLCDVIWCLTQSGLHVALTGNGPIEEGVQVRLLQLMQMRGCIEQKIYPLVNKITLVETLSLARDATFVISNDTGIANIVHTMGLRLLVATWLMGKDTFFPYPEKFDSANTRVLWCDCGHDCNAYTTYGCKFPYAEEYLCFAAIKQQDIMACVHDWIPPSTPK